MPEPFILVRSCIYLFPQIKVFKPSDVQTSFAGLRVLPHAKGRAFSRSRDTTFHVDKKLAPRVVTIYGGKLTAYRVTSEKFVAKFSKLMPKRTCKARTSNLQLSPDPQ